MLRTLALTTLLALSAGSAVADKTPPAKPVSPTAAPPVFPVPKDATTPEDAPGGGGAIKVYTVPRGRDAVIAEMRTAFKDGGWTISKDDPSPSGRAIRLEVTKSDKVYKVSFTGDATKTAMIVTLP